MIIYFTLATLLDHNIFSLDTPIFRDRAMTAFLGIFCIMTSQNILNALTSRFDPLASIRFIKFSISPKLFRHPITSARWGL